MRHVNVPALLALTVLSFALAFVPTSAQSQQPPRPAQLPPPGTKAQPTQQPPNATAPPPQAPGQAQAPAVAPPKSYKPVAVTLAAPAKDPSFDAFRRQLGDIAKRKDRAALAKLVVVQGFFWETESGDKADKKKSGIDNLNAVLDLNGQDPSGWEALSAAAAEVTLEPVSERKGVMCSPASPTFDEPGFQAMLKATDTDASEWAFPSAPNAEVRAAAQPSAAVVEKLGMAFVRVLPQDAPSAAAGGQPAPDAPPFLKVVTPGGKTGFLPASAISPLVFDQLCYLKDASGWKIAGYTGGE